MKSTIDSFNVKFPIAQVAGAYFRRSISQWLDVFGSQVDVKLICRHRQQAGSWPRADRSLPRQLNQLGAYFLRLTEWLDIHVDNFCTE